MLAGFAGFVAKATKLIELVQWFLEPALPNLGRLIKTFKKQVLAGFLGLLSKQ